jgi:hypothetical protein
MGNAYSAILLPNNKVRRTPPQHLMEPINGIGKCLILLLL